MNVHSLNDPERNDREAGWTPAVPGMWTAPVGTPEPEWPGQQWRDHRGESQRYLDDSQQFVIGAGAAYIISGMGADLNGYTFAGCTTEATVIRYTEDRQAEIDARYAALRRGLQGGTIRSSVDGDEAGLFLSAVTARLEPCPVCKATLVVVNGRIRGPHRLWSEGGTIAVTPHHAEDCPGRLPAGAVELPEGSAFTVGAWVVPPPVPGTRCATGGACDEGHTYGVGCLRRVPCPEVHPADGRPCARPVHSNNRHRAEPPEGRRRDDSDRWETRPATPEQPGTVTVTREELTGHIDDPVCQCHRCQPTRHDGRMCNCAHCVGLRNQKAPGTRSTPS